MAAKRKRDDDETDSTTGPSEGITDTTGMDGLVSKLTKTLDRELDKYRRPSRPVKFGSQHTVTLYNPSAAEPVSLKINELFQTDLAVALLFEGLVDNDSDPQYDIVELNGFKSRGAVVCNHVPHGLRQKRPWVTHIEDPTGSLAREFRVLDPLGGGRCAIESVVFLKSGVLLGILPINSVSRRRVPEIIDRFLSAIS